MRSYVCGQCHAEYYFEPEGKRVVFPWDKGLKPQDMYAYYQDRPAGFDMDWQHPDSQARELKAQHPDFELSSSGVHAQSGVACADCHMPYLRDNGRKYSSHWVTSPMKHIQASAAPAIPVGSMAARPRQDDAKSCLPAPAYGRTDHRPGA